MPVIQCYCRNVMPQKMCSDKPEGFKLLNYVSNSSTIQPFCQVCHTLSHSVTQPLRVPVLVDPTLFFPSPTPPPRLCVQVSQCCVYNWVKRLTCAHKIDSAAHTGFWLTCTHKIDSVVHAQPWGGGVGLVNFIIGTQPLLHFLRHYFLRLASTLQPWWVV